MLFNFFIPRGSGVSVLSYLTLVVLIKVYVCVLFVLVFSLVFTKLSFSNVNLVGGLISLDCSFDLGERGLYVVDLFAYLCVLMPLFISIQIVSITVSCMSLVASFMDIGYYVHVISFQWGWEFFYPVMDFNFSCVNDSVDLFLDRSGDLSLYVPVYVPCCLVLSSLDVIHSFCIDSLGVKLDAVPGHLNSVYVDVESVGVDAGQCSEYCGEAHSFMGFEVNFVRDWDFGVGFFLGELGA